MKAQVQLEISIIKSPQGGYSVYALGSHLFSFSGSIDELSKHLQKKGVKVKSVTQGFTVEQDS